MLFKFLKQKELLKHIGATHAGSVMLGGQENGRLEFTGALVQLGIRSGSKVMGALAKGHQIRMEEDFRASLLPQQVSGLGCRV